MIATPEELEKIRKKTWSYSSLHTFDTCPYSFYRLYGLEDRPELPNTFFGSAIHKVIENILNYKRFNLLSIFGEYKVSQSQLERFKVCHENSKKFLYSNIIESKFYSELKLGIKVGNHNLMCILDIMKWENPNHIFIYDIKSSTTHNYAKEYDFQSEVFTYVLKTIYPDKDISFFLYYPSTDKIISMTPSKSLPEIEYTIINKIENILNFMDFKPTPHKWCKNCEYLKQRTCEVFNN